MSEQPWGSEPTAKAKKPFYRKKRVMIPAGFLVVAAFAGGGGDDTVTTQNAAAEKAAAGTAVQPLAPAAEIDPAKAAADKAAADAKAAVDAKAAADKAAADKARAAAEKAASDKAAAEKAAAEKAAKGPADQQALLAAVVAGRQGYEGTDNELKQRQAQAARKQALLASIPSLEVTGWVGKIRSIDTNSEGKAVLELGIGDDTKVSTWNNALSDIMDNTLIPMDSPMYQALVNLEEGDKIKFSGTFFSDDEQGLSESSMTFNGQMMTPNFVFRFSSISPL